ncbi:MAG: DEAD/DEAH box helicase [Armatimonadetes bacterium]|nr:DEAD/DEAH box helicase [Armatimonadota bacterium]
MIRAIVQNTRPIFENKRRVRKEHLILLRSYLGREDVLPFEHQNDVFHIISKDKEVMLTAGTASGKTLAVAIPLFCKLQQGKISKVLFMYPTVALLEDQRGVMESLAEAIGFSNQIGQIQGGMSRSELIQCLSKRILLATPDEIYWFFRKNVKYNALLLYRLCQVDEFVLDEAHLFNGLMLKNFEHLWRRIKTLANFIGRTLRLHILTATPTRALQCLNNAKQICGKSKCCDVQVEFHSSSLRNRVECFVSAVDETLNKGCHKVLVICNSARMAHQLFEKCKVNESSAIPVEHRLKFLRC